MNSDREVRAMEFRALEGEKDKPSYKVEGYASTFDRYELMEIDGVKYYEQIERDAFADADFSDCVFRVDHEGMVYARTSAGTVEVDIDEDGLHSVTDLSRTELSRGIFDAIKAGNYPQMSFAFKVGKDAFDRDTNTRIISRIDKVYDISPVTWPANPNTEIHVRTYLDGVIKAAEAERLKREETERRDFERRESIKRKIKEVLEK